MRQLSHASWIGRAGAALAAAVVVLPAAGTSRAWASGTPDARTSGAGVTLIVEGARGALPAVESAVGRAGGTVDQVLSIINGVTATVPPASIARLEHSPGVVGVSPDSSMHLLSLPAGYDAQADGYSMYNVTLGTGAQAYWRAGYTGQGVGVALIDSGVSPVEGLQSTGSSPNVIYGPDLSFDSQSPNLAYLDSFGHGTHMAGIIAGRDPSAQPGHYAGDTTDFLGMAPDAHIVSIKVADTYGNTDVSQLIAAIDWAVQHRNDLNIRVMNLSVGTTPSQPYQVDPLAYAAQQAWDHGIVVVAAAGNDGTMAGGRPGPRSGSGLEDPAYDPNILAVGAANTHGTLSTRDDTVAAFSADQGSGATDGTRRPDLVAPGMHIASLRDPGSWIDRRFAGTGAVDSRLMRGSGTSQAAAVVSGAAALIISQHPAATPGQVKALLMATADPLPRAPASDQGKGEIDLSRALTTPLPPTPPTPPTPPAATTPSPSTGSTLSAVTTTGPAGGPVAEGPKPKAPPGAASQVPGGGSLQGSRGGDVLTAPSGTALRGNFDIFGTAVDTAALAAAEAAGTAWSGGTFDGNLWAGTGWVTDPLLGRVWATATWANDWSGQSWATLEGSSNTSSGNTWSGNTWSGNTWSGNTWSGNTWSGVCWAAAGWS